MVASDYLTPFQIRQCKAGLIILVFILVGLVGIIHDVMNMRFSWIPITSPVAGICLIVMSEYTRRHGLRGR